MKTRLIFVIITVLLASCTANPSPNASHSNSSGIAIIPTSINNSLPTSIQTSVSSAIYPTETSPTFISPTDDTAQKPAVENEAPTQTEKEQECARSEGFDKQENLKAINCWQNVLILQKNDFYALYGLTWLYAADGQWQKSIDFGKVALIYAPTNKYETTVLLDIGIAANYLGDHTSSIDYYNQVIKIADPDDRNIASAYLQLASVYNNDIPNQKSKACEYFKQAMDTASKLNDTDTLMLRGEQKFYCQ